MDTNSRPSALLCLDDPLAAYQLDAAVVAFGRIIENALQERKNVGTTKEPKYAPMYTIDQLLAPAFRLPRSKRVGDQVDAAQNAAAHQQLMSLSRQARSNVKVFKYVGPLN